MDWTPYFGGYTLDLVIENVFYAVVMGLGPVIALRFASVYAADLLSWLHRLFGR